MHSDQVKNPFPVPDATAPSPHRDRHRIAVIGSGISGLGCAWLLARQDHVTLFEAADYFGGHTHTVDIEATALDGRPVELAVDTGFIVFNDRNYPNLLALFDRLGVAFQPSNMTFSVSTGGGALEYAGNGLRNVFAQPANALRPRFWRLLSAIRTFYREAGALDPDDIDGALTLGTYLRSRGYDSAFVDDHLLPMVAAIWSCPAAAARDYPFRSFLKFAQNHGLVSFRGRPQWLTVTGGARHYVEAILRAVAESGGDVRKASPVARIDRHPDRVEVVTRAGDRERFDQVVLATHADTSLALLDQPSAQEQRLLAPFRYTTNAAYFHADPRLMPKRRAAWAAWNYLERADESDAPALFCSYWMNRLQSLATREPLVVTLNPPAPPSAELVFETMTYTHPIFDSATQAAQAELWSLQGARRTWFCGSYFGAGFHEDGLQAGLAVAEQLGGAKRPWSLPAPSDRIIVHDRSAAHAAA